MNKFKSLSIILSLSLLFLIVGCSDVEVDSVTQKEEPGNTEVVEEEPVEEEPVEEGLATRKNPASFGETVHAIGDYNGTPIEYEITLSNLIRGEEAEKLALSMNQFNEWSEDEEPILFDVEFNLIKYEPEDDDYYWVSDSDFKIFESSYSEYNTDNYLSIDNEFGGEIYEGGNAAGKVGEVISKDDQSLIVFDGSFWFQLP